MEVMVFQSVVFLFLLYFMYRYVTLDRLTVSTREAWKLSDKQAIFILVVIGFIIRAGYGIHYSDKASDLNNLRWLLSTIRDGGYEGVYASGTTVSFSPVVMQLMAAAGGFAKVLHVDDTKLATTAWVILFKLPSIVCDLLTISLLFKIAKKNFRTRGAMLLAAAYAFNPCSIMDSGIWAQIDGVLALCGLLVCWFLYKKKPGFAVIAFTLAILTEPIAIVLTPVLVIGIIDDLFLDGFVAKEAGKFAVCLVGSIAGVILICLPMGVSKVWENTLMGINGLQYCSVNGYNFWNLIGFNWTAENTTYLGVKAQILSAVLVCAGVIFMVIYHYVTKRKKENYFVIGAFSVMLLFGFGMRMHERYLFISMILLLAGYLMKPVIENYLLYIFFTMVQFGNMAYVFYVYSPTSYNPKATCPKFVSLMFMVGFIAFLVKMCMHCFSKRAAVDNAANVEKTVKQEARIEEKSPILASVKMPKWTKYDTIAVLAITIVYSCFAMHDVGNRYAPSTEWLYDQNSTEVANEIILDLGENSGVQNINYFLGNYENRKCKVESGDALTGPWTEYSNFDMVSVFCWGQQPIPIQNRYIRISFDIPQDQWHKKVSIKELVFTRADGTIITPLNSNDYPNLFDEQEMFPGRSTFRDSTYFDEIYHARTAYEFVHGLTTYENTHPPLGKIIMSLGVRAFGMNPFGWRIMGVLFGIFMVPVMYAFSRRMFKETWIATVATIMLAFDFMHFSQTRIATIDVFVTFFIICSYYFMYKYYQMSFYDTSLKKTFMTLGACGILMGCQMAAKWTGVYAAGGLAVIFFVTLGKRFQEYLYAKKHLGGVTNGISHDYIAKNFIGHTVKTVLFCCVFFVVIPAVIYTASYLPFYDYEGTTGLVDKMLKNQHLMFTYHQGVDQVHPFSSRWWQWPIIYRPIWYFSGIVNETTAEGISAFGNPAVWWAGIPAFFYLLHRVIRKSDKKALFLVIGYLSQYLPWVFIGRTTFIYHYFTSVPFVVLMVAYCLYLLVKKVKVPKAVVFGYAGIVVILFLLFYPVLSGQPVNKQFVYHILRWMDTWVLVG